MIPKNCLTSEVQPDDYIPVRLDEIAAFTGNICNAGISLANGSLPLPSIDRGVPTVFTHFDGVDALDRFDPSPKSAIDDDRAIRHIGLTAMRRANDPSRLIVVAATYENKWSSRELDIIRFWEKPELAIDAKLGKLVVVRNAHSISSAIEKLFPKK